MSFFELQTPDFGRGEGISRASRRLWPCRGDNHLIKPVPGKARIQG